jgi:methyl-galactoside transport system permease protein
MACMLFIIVILSIINPRFMSGEVLKDILMQNSTRLIIACGMTFVLISGGLDLSAGRIVGLAAVITASLGQYADYKNKFFPGMPELSVAVPILMAVGIGALCGLLNGILVAKVSIPPFIVTLGTQMAIWGVNLIYFGLEPNSSQPIGGITNTVKFFGSGLLGGIFPTVIIIAIVVIVLTWFVLKYFVFGRNVYAIGGNREAALVSGVKTNVTLIVVYVIAGLFYGIAGFLECARTGGATAAYGVNYEFDAIAACVVGGVSNYGGIGTVPGMILGVLLFGIINYGLTFIGVTPYVQQVMKGIIIIAAVGFDVKRNKKRI